MERLRPLDLVRRRQCGELGRQRCGRRANSNWPGSSRLAVVLAHGSVRAADAAGPQGRRGGRARAARTSRQVASCGWCSLPFGRGDSPAVRQARAVGAAGQALGAGRRAGRVKPFPSGSKRPKAPIADVLSLRMPVMSACIWLPGRNGPVAPPWLRLQVLGQPRRAARHEPHGKSLGAVTPRHTRAYR
jgi:hypothetical protein